MMTVVDEYSKECLAIEVASSITAQGVIRVFQNLFTDRGAPNYLRSDNGPEMIAKRLKTWLSHQQVETLYIEPGSPWQNGRNESFNGRLRDECLNLEWFYNISEANYQEAISNTEVIIAEWIKTAKALGRAVPKPGKLSQAQRSVSRPAPLKKISQ